MDRDAGEASLRQLKNPRKLSASDVVICHMSRLSGSSSRAGKTKSYGWVILLLDDIT